MQKITAALMLFLTFFTSMVVVLAGLWYLAPTAPSYETIENSEHRAYIQADTLVLYRAFIVRKHVPITISRELVRVDNAGTDVLHKISLPDTVVDYEPGVYRIFRHVELPANLPSGKYKVVNWARWKINPIRDGYTQLPVVYVEKR